MILLGKPQASQGWNRTPLGAGGLVAGIDITAATKVCWTDVGGAYLLDENTNRWQQVITSASMPAADVSKNHWLSGVFGMAVAPSNTNTVYMAYRAGSRETGQNAGWLYKSTDRCSTWVRTTLTHGNSTNYHDWDGNSDWKHMSPKLAVDPANSSVVLVGMSSTSPSIAPCKITVDGGTTWSDVSGLPNTTERPAVICFDPSSAVTGGKTQGIYIFVYGEGLFRSTNGGTSFTEVDAGGSFTLQVQHMRCASDGVLYFTDKVNSGLYKYTGSGSVTSIKTGNLTGQIPECVIVSPYSAAKVICAVDGGQQYISTDRGANWTAGGTKTRTATDVRWLGWANEAYMTIGDMMMDPVVTDKIWFGQGIGVWTSSAAVALTANDYTSVSAGIEELISHMVLHPPGGFPVVACSDRAVFPITEVGRYPATHGPNADIAIQYGSGLDWATTDPKFIALFDVWNVGGANDGVNSSYSQDGGLTWALFPTFPSDPEVNPNGSIAVSTRLNMVINPCNRSDLYNTKDGGVTWNRIDNLKFTTNGVTHSGVIDADGGATHTGWRGSTFLNQQNICADRVTPGTFYAHNWQFEADGGGVYKSVDGGDNWVRQSTSFVIGFGPSYANNAKLRPVPNLSNAGTGGHLFFTAGANDSQALYYSNDGGVSWTAVADTGETLCFGFGAVKSGNDYPSVFMAGEVGSVYGLWRSDNSKAQWASNSVTWTSLGAYPMDCLSEISWIEGDHNVWSRAYAASKTFGCFYYQP